MSSIGAVTQWTTRTEYEAAKQRGLVPINMTYEQGLVAPSVSTTPAPSSPTPPQTMPTYVEQKLSRQEAREQVESAAIRTPITITEPKIELPSRTPAESSELTGMANPTTEKWMAYEQQQRGLEEGRLSPEEVLRFPVVPPVTQQQQYEKVFGNAMKSQGIAGLTWANEVITQRADAAARSGAKLDMMLVNLDKQRVDIDTINQQLGDVASGAKVVDGILTFTNKASYEKYSSLVGQGNALIEQYNKSVADFNKQFAGYALEKGSYEQIFAGYEAAWNKAYSLRSSMGEQMIIAGNVSRKKSMTTMSRH